MNLVDEIIIHLEKYYGKKLNDLQRATYQTELSSLKDGPLIATMHKVCAKEVMMPTVFIIKRYYTEHMDAQHAEVKKQSPVFRDIEKNAKSSKHGRDAMALNAAFGSGKISRAQYLAGMEKLESEHPGKGWQQCANDLKAFWASEPKRHAVGNAYLERIWRLQDANGMKTHSSPHWYVDKQKEFLELSSAFADVEP